MTQRFRRLAKSESVNLLRNGGKLPMAWAARDSKSKKVHVGSERIRITYWTIEHVAEWIWHFFQWDNLSSNDHRHCVKFNRNQTPGGNFIFANYRLKPSGMVHGKTESEGPVTIDPTAVAQL